MTDISSNTNSDNTAEVAVAVAVKAADVVDAAAAVDDEKLDVEAEANAAVSVRPSVAPALMELPRDQYAHPGSPTEWWWHVGTLTSIDGSRVFGFEVNGGLFVEGMPVLVSELEITDVQNKKVYQATDWYHIPNADEPVWAEADPAKEWYVKLERENCAASVSMKAIDGNPLNMVVVAKFLADAKVATEKVAAPAADPDPDPVPAADSTVAADAEYINAAKMDVNTVVVVVHLASMIAAALGASGTAVIAEVAAGIMAAAEAVEAAVAKKIADDLRTPCSIVLSLFNENLVPPHALFVGGTGYVPNPDHDACTTAYNSYNYYYSFTNLQASGLLTIGDEVIPVRGLTWMDHEYGFFPKGDGATWCLQAIQITLRNGKKLHFSSYTKFGTDRTKGTAVPSITSVVNLRDDGQSEVFDSQTTLLDRFESTYGDTTSTYYRTIKIDGFPEKAESQFAALLGTTDADFWFEAKISNPGQVLDGPVFEGVGICHFYSGDVLLATGTAWIEQKFK